MLTVLLYLGAAIAANLITAHFGPAASVFTAFALIGLNLTSRDRLHDAWHGQGLRWKMAALIATGSLLSWLASPAAGRIALASAASFGVSEGVDALLYSQLLRRHWSVRTNGSNIGSAAVDSFLFPSLAFGVFLPWVILGQFLAKTLGGAVWSWLLRPRVAVAVGALLLCAAPLTAQKKGPPRFVVQAQMGTSHYSWESYQPVPSIGGNILVFLPFRTSLIFAVSHDLRPRSGVVGLFGVQLKLFER